MVFLTGEVLYGRVCVTQPSGTCFKPIEHTENEKDIVISVQQKCGKWRDENAEKGEKNLKDFFLSSISDLVTTYTDTKDMVFLGPDVDDADWKQIALACVRVPMCTFDRKVLLYKRLMGAAFQVKRGVLCKEDNEKGREFRVQFGHAPTPITRTIREYGESNKVEDNEVRECIFDAEWCYEMHNDKGRREVNVVVMYSRVRHVMASKGMKDVISMGYKVAEALYMQEEDLLAVQVDDSIASLDEAIFVGCLSSNRGQVENALWNVEAIACRLETEGKMSEGKGLRDMVNKARDGYGLQIRVVLTDHGWVPPPTVSKLDDDARRGTPLSRFCHEKFIPGACYAGIGADVEDADDDPEWSMGVYVIYAFSDANRMLSALYGFLQGHHVLSSFNIRTDLTTLLLAWREHGICSYNRVHEEIDGSFVSDPHFIDELPGLDAVVKATTAARDMTEHFRGELRSGSNWRSFHVIWPGKVLVPLETIAFEKMKGVARQEQISMSLDDVSKRFLPGCPGKKLLAGPPSLNELVSYCARDADLHRRLHDEFDAVGVAALYSKLSAMPMQSMFPPPKTINTNILMKALNPRYVIPMPEGDYKDYGLLQSDLFTKDRSYTPQQSLKGALKVTREAGPPSYMVVIDIKSFYPWVVSALNMSPETLCGYNTKIANLTKVETSTGVTSQEFHLRDIRQKYSFAECPNGNLPVLSLFRTDEEGALSALMRELIETRAMLQSLGMHAMANQAKLIANSFIGCFSGNKGSNNKTARQFVDLFGSRIGEAVYGYGRYVMIQLIKGCESLFPCATCGRIHRFLDNDGRVQQYTQDAEVCQRPKKSSVPCALLAIDTDSFSLACSAKDIQHPGFEKFIVSVIEDISTESCGEFSQRYKLKFTPETMGLCLSMKHASVAIWEPRRQGTCYPFTFKGVLVNKNTSNDAFCPHKQQLMRAVCKYVISRKTDGVMGGQESFVIRQELLESLQWLSTSDDRIGLFNNIFEQMEACYCSDVIHELMGGPECVNNEILQEVYSHSNNHKSTQLKRRRDVSYIPDSFYVLK